MNRNREHFLTRKSWEIPAEPDESVTHVMDTKTARVWERRDRMWFAPGKRYGIYWNQLLAYGPLYDVTGDNDE